MSSPLSHLMSRAGYTTLASLARDTVEQWCELEPDSSASRKSRNIEVKLGLLRRGVTTWWTNHAHAAAALAATLGVTEADLGISATASTPHRALEFADFPALRPFDPLRDSPCDAWGALAPQRFLPMNLFKEVPDVPRAWVHMPPGGGRKFLAHFYEITMDVELVRGYSLGECRHAMRGEMHTVIVVDTPSANDSEILLSFTGDPPITILAPFRLSAAGRGHQLAGTPQWVEYAWRTRPNWRKHFVKWVAARIEGETHFETRRFLRWLDEIDPDGTMLDTPGALLPVCALAHERGSLRGVDRDNLARTLVDAWLVHAEIDDAATERWLHAHGAKTVRALSHARMQSVDVPWASDLTRAQWAALVPNEVIPERPSDRRLRALLSAVDNDDADERRAVLEQLDAAITAPSPAEAVHKLENAGLFRTEPGGRMWLHPTWLAIWWGRERIRRALTTEPPGAWGIWVLDHDRRRMIDDEIGQLADWDFNELLGETAALEARSLAAVGAIETMFFAVANRLLSGWRGEAATLHRLWHLQQTCLVQRYEQGGLAPMTRPAPGDWSETTEAWLAACWSWSFKCPRPDVDPDTFEPWLYPGWRSPSLGAADAIRQTLSGPGADAPTAGLDFRGLPSAYERRPFVVLLHFARDLVAALDDVELPDRIPELLLPSVVLECRARGWKLRESHLASLRSRWAVEQLHQDLMHLPPDHQVAVSRELITLATQHDLVMFGAYLGPLRDLGAFALENVPEGFLEDRVDAMMERTAEQDVAGVVTSPSMHPQARLAVIRWFSEHHPEALDHVCGDELFITGSCDLDTLTALADARPDRWLAVRTLWRMAPDRALERIETGPLAEAKMEYWFNAAPAHMTSRLLDILEELADDGLPAWVPRWLARRLQAHTGELARRVFALLRANGS